MIDTLVICVNFHNDDDVRLLSNDLAEQDAGSCPLLIVVDNSANDDGKPLVREALSQSGGSILTPPRNLGYFGGAEYGLAQYVKNYPMPTWVVIANPDIRIRQKSFFRDLAARHCGKDIPAVVAPSLQSLLSGKDQNPYLRRRPSRARMRFYSWLFSVRTLAIWYERLSFAMLRVQHGLRGNGRHRAGLQAAPERIYAPHGSLILFHRSYFEHGGSLHYRTFMFGEEIFVAETARQLGLAIMYDPWLRAEHKQGTPLAILHNSSLARYARDAARFLADEYFDGKYD